VITPAGLLPVPVLAEHAAIPPIAATVIDPAQIQAALFMLCSE
jgi:hypothetical protein